MAFEIELKAWVDEPLTLKKRLFTQGEYESAYEKDDTYWVFPERAVVQVPAQSPATGSFPASGVRVRRERHTGPKGGTEERVLVTYKVKEILDGIEINDEREFEVSDGKVFEDLLECLGLCPGSIKKKKGWAWNCSPRDSFNPQAADVRAELSQVEGLGWFIELEIIAGDKDEATIAQGRTRLLSLLDVLEIPRSRIEGRTYTGMLRDLAAMDLEKR
jgi:adenylate cyclase class 2